MAADISAERAVARSAIIDILHRYANLACENADFDLIASTLFTSDGEFAFPDLGTMPVAEMGRIVGEDAPAYLRHHITTVVIDFRDDDTAEVDAYFLAYMGSPLPDHWGRWRDVVRRQDGVWRIARMEPIVEGFDPHGLWAARVDELASGRA